MLLALLGATAGQGVVWYTGQFYALFFLTITLKVDYITAYILIAISLLIGTPFFIFFGWLSDRIGRLKIILAGCLIAALTYFPLFGGADHCVNPALAAFQAKKPITVAADPATCNFHIFVGPWSKFTDCDRAKDFADQARACRSQSKHAPAGAAARRDQIGDDRLKGWDAEAASAALTRRGLSGQGRSGARSTGSMAELILVIMVIYVTMVYGPIAAFLVELFPTRSATPRCRCPITSATAGSAACCRCWPPRSWRRPAISIPACGIRSSWRS